MTLAASSALRARPEVELVAHAGFCPRCGRASVDVKERPVVKVRDLPLTLDGDGRTSRR
jgi:hypothetical protein